MRRFLLSSLIACGCLGLGLGCASRARRSLELYEAGDYTGAARAADEGLAQHPGDGDLWRMKIRAALALGDAAGVATAYAAHEAQRGEDDRELVRELAIATVRQALASPSVRLQILAIQAIEAAELHAFADEVADRIGDDDDRVAAAAATAVLRGYPHAPQVASEMLRSEDPEARRIAVEGIGKKVGELAVADLQRAATDLDPRVRGAAIRWIGQLKLAQAEPVLLRRLRDPDPSVRAAAARALARIGTGDLAAHGTKALNDRALAVRLAGVELLAAAKASQQLTTVAERDPDPIVAAEAAIALANPALALRALERAATDARPETRAAAANLAVRAVGKEQALPLVDRLAADPEPSVRLAAGRAIASAGASAGARDRALAIFAAALDTPSLRLAAATDLARLGDPRGVETLSNVVRDTSTPSDARSAAVAAHLTARAITPGLVAALADPSGIVRAEAASALLSLAK